MIRQKLIRTEAFKNAVESIFKLVDQNNDNHIDRDELTIAICQLHYKLAAKHPGLTTSPSKELIDKTLDECDIDRSGSLSKEEFEIFATKWFEQESVIFLVRITIISAMTMVVLPGGANILHERVAIVRPVPKILFKVLLGIAFKIASVAIKEKMDAERE